jgi:predicted aldo/keto reductase-like oxidoreductase
MLYRRFGRTELQIPVLSCGGMRYQHKWQDVPLSEVPEDNQRNLEATIRRSVEVGINHIETARGYGSSERQLGLILPTFPREELIVQTKIGPEEDPKVFRKNFEESLERLRLSHVDLLAIHGINDAECLRQSVRKGGCLAVCRELQKEGLARHIGFSTHAHRDLILEAIRTKEYGGFDYVNLHWYFIFRHNWPCVLEARERDMGVFIISPSDKGGMLYKPTDKLRQLTAPLHPIVFNDLWCLDRPEIHTLSVGAARPTDFDEHLEAVKLYEQRKELIAPIVERLEAEMREVAGSLFVADHHENLPQWEETPGEVNIPIILWLLNLSKTFDMVEYGQMRYNLLGNAGHWFPGKNAAELDEAALKQKLNGAADQVIARLKEAHQLLYKAPVKRLSQS